tara:strand:- start:355 stop:546 length:192 start_codon:yes stop_codon:yes gene_type:complete
MSNSVRKFDDEISNVTATIINDGHANNHSSKQIRQSVRACPVRKKLIRRRAEAIAAMCNGRSE